MASVTIYSSSSDSRVQGLAANLTNTPTSGQSTLDYMNTILAAFDNQSDSMASDLSYRYISDTLVSSTLWRIQTTNYTIEVTGTLSTLGSNASKIMLLNKNTGDVFTASGAFNYVGLPLASKLVNGSFMDYASVTTKPAFSGYKSLTATFDVSLFYGSTGYSGKLQSYTESLFDYSNIQTATSFQSSASITDVAGTLKISDGTLSSILIGISGSNGSTPTDSVSIDGIQNNLSQVLLSNPWFSVLAGNDTIVLKGTGALPAISGDGADTFTNGPGNTPIDGGEGTDTLVQNGIRANYTISKDVQGSTTTYTIYDKTGKDGSDKIVNIEKVHFNDVTVNTTVGDLAKTISTSDLKLLEELYVAFFNRVPDADGLSYWISQRQQGVSVDQIAQSFYGAAVQFADLTGYSSTMSNSDFVKVIYKNVLGRSGITAPPDADVQYWAGELSASRATKGSLVSGMLGSAHSFKGNPTWGWVADLLDNKVTVANHFAVNQGLTYNTPQDSITKGMAIAAAVTASDTTAAISLIGISDSGFNLS
jgi:hypothetical protein